MLDQGDAKYRLPKGTMPSIVSRRGRYVRTLRFASSSLKDDAGPRSCQVSSPERDNAKYRLPKGTIRENATFRIVLAERRCWKKGMPSIVSRKGQCQVSSHEGDDTLERFVSHRPL